MALMTYTEITLDCKSIDWSSGRRKKNVEGEKVVLIISVIYQHAGKLKWEKLLEMEIWLKAKVHLWVSSSPFPYCYLTLQSHPSDSSRLCCSHRLDLQPNPRAGWAACTLLKSDCFKIFTQETRAAFSNDSKLLLPKPWGAQSNQGWVVQLWIHCFPPRSASVHWIALFVPSPCSLVTQWTPRGSQH